MSALEARGLELTYPGPRGERALAGVDLDLACGETVCVLGPNGSGKSTLLRILGGLLAPDAGLVRLFGEDLASLSTRQRARRIASVPQSLRALPQVRVEHFVLGGRYAHRGWLGRPDANERRALEDALAEADARAFRGRLLGELSGGQWQRVLVARALAQEADVLLFDEPTASLDPEHQVAVFELIARLTAAGRAALIATHELNLASRYAARVLLLEEGRVRAAGGVEEVLRPEVLGPVYGRHLLFSRTPPRAEDGASWPLVLPWPAAPAAPGEGEGDPSSP